MLMLDANVVIALVAGHSVQLRDRFIAASAQQELALSSIVIFELQFGIAKSKHRLKNADALRRFLSGVIQVVAFDEEDATVSGQIRATLQDQGTPIGPFDVMVAGHALRHGATLVTANIREFSRVDGLKLENWATAGTP
jgi:tRNA(fMet)-specific endonuclease VapC